MESLIEINEINIKYNKDMSSAECKCIAKNENELNKQTNKYLIKDCSKLFFNDIILCNDVPIKKINLCFDDKEILIECNNFIFKEFLPSRENKDIGAVVAEMF